VLAVLFALASAALTAHGHATGPAATGTEPATAARGMLRGQRTRAAGPHAAGPRPAAHAASATGSGFATGAVSGGSGAATATRAETTPTEPARAATTTRAALKITTGESTDGPAADR
jgi:hypothetical protein